MNLRDIATSLACEERLATKTSHQKTLLFAGSKCSGKTTLINHFLDKNEPAKKTLTLDYTFARKTSSPILAKEICHVWELGGGSLFTSVLGNGGLLASYGPLTVIVMVDLSELDQLWFSLETLLDSLKTRLTNLPTKNISSTAFYKDLCDHPDYSLMTPFPVPLVIIGGKYDIFQEYEPEKKKIVSRCLQYVSHILCGTLVYYSSKDASLVKRVKEVLNHYAFGSPQLKTICKDYNKPICVPCGSNSMESIEGIGSSSSFTLDRARHVFTTLFPQDNSKVISAILDDPTNDPNFREPLVDALRRQKCEELERYCQEMERREKRNLESKLTKAQSVVN